MAYLNFLPYFILTYIFNISWSRRLLDELIAQSLRNFQADCLNFSKQNYPTVHNRGIKESHMGRALCRRVIHSFESIDIPASSNVIENVETLSQPIFCIDAENYQILIVVHRLLSANFESRKGLIRDVMGSLEFKDMRDKKERRLIIIADHWADRSHASKSIPSWWLGHQPIHQIEYAEQGIKLTDAKHFFSDDIQQECKLKGGQHRIYHPLHRYKDGLPFFKYMLLTATYPL